MPEEEEPAEYRGLDDERKEPAPKTGYGFSPARKVTLVEAAFPSAKAFREDERACLEAGMNDFITKPIDYKLLVSRISMWLADANAGVREQSSRSEELRTLMGNSAYQESLVVLAMEVRQRLASIHQALHVKDLAAVKFASHTLVGVFAGYGFEDLRHLCTAIEACADAGLEPAPAAVRRLDELCSDFLLRIDAQDARVG